MIHVDWDRPDIAGTKEAMIAVGLVRDATDKPLCLQCLFLGVQSDEIGDYNAPHGHTFKVISVPILTRLWNRLWQRIIELQDGEPGFWPND